MSNHERSADPKKTTGTDHDTSNIDTDKVEKSQEQHTRDSGRFGADEPDYGRAPGDRPEPTPKSGPNSQGAQYEEGGRYPGTRDTTEKTHSRSADPGQSSYGGFKNEDPGFQRQEKPLEKKP